MNKVVFFLLNGKKTRWVPSLVRVQYIYSDQFFKSDFLGITENYLIYIID